MDKINLDISKYTCKELEEIFNIDIGSNANDISEQIQKFKNNLNDNEKLDFNTKNNINNFLIKVVDKLTKQIANNENQMITASISQLDNNKIEKFSFKNKNEIDKAISSINKKKFNITDISSKIINITSIETTS